ncbi:MULTISPECIES: NAD(P)H-dependent oxidoreductase [Bacillaceae]|uniref:NAD(P)H-dependent oxidoreductase n=1 Tax=Evansella alkalicola TaxID=745819 RepID=A0ABS6JTE2_9BACI|nr:MULTISPECIES: NAD(P)H-dependent oxidoreductase [Bacillaceae]MBU9721856.1 NAD(P)H-dependent oxidoreductase [Bacillus alkalicola]
MNHLIIYMHPTLNSFNGAILNAYSKTLKTLGHEVNIRNLYEQDFQPLLQIEEYKESLKGKYSIDIKKEHQFLQEADYITLLFPYWWGGFPAIGKGYIDRVFSYGVAYELEGEDPIPLLSGKKVAMIYTTGTPKEQLISEKIEANFLDLIDKTMFQFCGLENKGSLHFGDVIQCSDDERQKMLEQVEYFAKSNC